MWGLEFVSQKAIYICLQEAGSTNSNSGSNSTRVIQVIYERKSLAINSSSNWSTIFYEDRCLAHIRIWLSSLPSCFNVRMRTLGFQIHSVFFSGWILTKVNGWMKKIVFLFRYIWISEMKSVAVIIRGASRLGLQLDEMNDLRFYAKNWNEDLFISYE